MVTKNEIKKILGKMILSASGWRGIFNDNEESKNGKISNAHRIISGAAAYVFAEYLKKRDSSPNPVVLLGADTRPTGKAIIEAIIPVLLASGCEVRYAGITAAPEIMAWARNEKKVKDSAMNSNKPAQTEKKYDGSGSCGLCSKNSVKPSGFIYISASHNPIGHNGIKFGLTDGGVLAADETAMLIDRFRAFTDRDDCVAIMENLASAADQKQIAEVYNNINTAKSEAIKVYYDFCGDVVWGSDNCSAAAFKEGLAKRPIGIVCDFNGSARAASIDRDFLSSYGFKFKCINSEPGQIAHRIVPEGESLEPCRILLEEAHSKDASFVMGYVPDCDGDRGNLVIWDDAIGKARALEAQEVFALACAAELSHLVWTKGSEKSAEDNEQFAVNSGQSAVNCKLSAVDGKLYRAAIAINDPTSMRVDWIAKAFGVSVFRAEVGEANVVSLARKLRKEGYLVRILGEGSAGGNITHPSAVRDPLHTVMAIAKMLSIRLSNNNEQLTMNDELSRDSFGGLFGIWCGLSGQIDKYRKEFTLADIIASLPRFVTTSAYNKDACLRIKTDDHALLKDRYQQIFLGEWEQRKDDLKARFDFQGWEAVAYNGMAETRGLKRFGDAGRGGLKILFTDSGGRETAYIWMRGSATEPVFRIMADIKGSDNQSERYLLEWQKKMIMEADES